MNLKTHIRPQLWQAISNTYEAENYTHAILDAMHCLSDILREKSGVDGDGHGLVGKVLGGKSPVLRVNRFQTESEQNEQKGLEQILRGLYQGIRNPRSHEQIEDTKDTTDAIIYFINYLVGILDKSQEPFTLPGFLARVFDPHFVQSARYAELLAKEIPTNKQTDTLVEVYRRKREGQGENLQYVVAAILKQLAADQITGFLAIVSEELRTTQDDVDYRMTLQILPPKLWPRLSEVARLRAENRLIKSIREGEVDSSGRTMRGALGTWARDFLKYFNLKSRVGDAILEKLEGSYQEKSYVFRFFLQVLPVVYDTSYRKNRCLGAINEAIGEDSEFEARLRGLSWQFPKDWRDSAEEMLNGTYSQTAEVDADGIPF